jgi:hypothetical protein
VVLQLDVKEERRRLASLFPFLGSRRQQSSAIPACLTGKKRNFQISYQILPVRKSISALMPTSQWISRAKS